MLFAMSSLFMSSLLFSLLRFGGSVENYPHPEADWSAFIRCVQNENSRLPLVWDPVSKRMKPWVDTKALTSLFKKGSCVVS
jgi:hypothetical protein